MRATAARDQDSPWTGPMCRLVETRKGDARVLLFRTPTAAEQRRGRDAACGGGRNAEYLAAAGWPLPRPPYLLEASRPGIFAVGDIRAGNVKRVASAVGEGSIAISFVHQLLRQ